jgi:hypothetical protein
MNYQQAIKDASYFRVEIDIDGQPTVTTRKASREWLNETNKWLKSVRDNSGVVACRVTAVLPDGREIPVSGFEVEQSSLTEEERIEGRTAFMNDQEIARLTGVAR